MTSALHEEKQSSAARLERLFAKSISGLEPKAGFDAWALIFELAPEIQGLDSSIASRSS